MYGWVLGELLIQLITTQSLNYFFRDLLFMYSNNSVRELQTEHRNVKGCFNDYYFFKKRTGF